MGAAKPNLSMLLAIARSCCRECFRGLLGFGMMESIGMWMIASRSNAEGEVAMPSSGSCCLVVLRIKAPAASAKVPTREGCIREHFTSIKRVKFDDLGSDLNRPLYAWILFCLSNG